MSGPCLALAAAAKLGIRLSVDCSTVSIVMFGWSASYFCTESATKLFMPAASWSPHHHMVRCTGPLDDDAGALDAPLDESALEPLQPAATTTTAASRTKTAVVFFTIAILLRFRDPLKKSLSARRRR